MPGALTTTGAVLVAVAIALVFPTVQRLGAFRSVQLTGSRDCITVPELKACEGRPYVSVSSVQPLI